MLLCLLIAALASRFWSIDAKAGFGQRPRDAVFFYYFFLSDQRCCIIQLVPININVLFFVFSFCYDQGCLDKLTCTSTNFLSVSVKDWPSRPGAKIKYPFGWITCLEEINLDYPFLHCLN